MPSHVELEIIDLKHEPRHIELLADWHHREWTALNPGRTLEQRVADMQSYLSEELVPSTFVARGGQVMGSAAITANDMDTHPELTPWLASVYVAPAFRRQGVGGRLVKHVMRQAAEAGIDTLYLFTPDRVSFYENLGWRVCSEEQYRGHVVTVMRVDLVGTTESGCLKPA